MGPAESVADEIERCFEGRAFDGINVHAGHSSQFRRFTSEVIPPLQARGVFRTEYEHTTPSGNLGFPTPSNNRSGDQQREGTGDTLLMNL